MLEAAAPFVGDRDRHYPPFSCMVLTLFLPFFFYDLRRVFVPARYVRDGRRSTLQYRATISRVYQLTQKQSFRLDRRVAER